MPPRPRLGGMALANGLLVHGPTHWAAATRGADGAITVASGRKPRFARGAIGAVPIVRGVLRLAESLAVLPAMRRGTPSARFAVQERAGYIGVAVALAGTAIARRRLRSPIAQEAVAALAGLVPTLAALRASDASRWHSVEHKSIAAYEAGGPDEVARAHRHPKEHPRCGSNLVLPMMATTTAVNALGRGLGVGNGIGGRVATSVIGMGAAVELFAFAHRRPRNPISRIVHGAGWALQAGFATTEPDADQMAVGKEAMDRLFLVEGIEQ
jgi:uncharacterized protein YqhQ